MKRTKMKMSIGTVDFAQLDLCGGMDLFFNISDMPEMLRAEVMSAIDKRKLEYIDVMKEILPDRNWKYEDVWSNEGVVVTSQLHVNISEMWNLTYTISVLFIDAVNENMFETIDLPIENMQNENLLRKYIAKSIMDNLV